jgi:hypothetical protein
MDIDRLISIYIALFAPISLLTRIIGLTAIIISTANWIYISRREYFKYDKTSTL